MSSAPKNRPMAAKGHADYPVAPVVWVGKRIAETVNLISALIFRASMTMGVMAAVGSHLYQNHTPWVGAVISSRRTGRCSS